MGTYIMSLEDDMMDGSQKLMEGLKFKLMKWKRSRRYGFCFIRQVLLTEWIL
jgi:hypothetical protein